jgi:hypothetical protein
MDTHSHTAPQPQQPSRGEVITGPLRSDEEILGRVGQLIDAEDRQRQSLWLFFLDRDGQQMPVVVPIDDVPDYPDLPLVGNVCWIVAEVLAEHEPTGAAVITLSRPGAAEFGDVDRHWYRALRDGAREHGAAIRMLCLATPDGVRQLAAA